MSRLTVWWENKDHTVATAYSGEISCATGHGSTELGALRDLWIRLGDNDAPVEMRDYVANLYRSLSGGRDVAALLDDRSNTRPR
jgi:hypothetical protein